MQRQNKSEVLHASCEFGFKLRSFLNPGLPQTKCETGELQKVGSDGTFRTVDPVPPFFTVFKILPENLQGFGGVGGAFKQIHRGAEAGTTESDRSVRLRRPVGGPLKIGFPLKKKNGGSVRQSRRTPDRGA